MKHPVGLAVLGAGLIGAKHIEHIAAEPGAQLVAIVDPSPKARALAEQHGARWFEDCPAMLAALRPDGLVAATPNRFHVANGLDAVAARIPILIEKPLADDLAAGAALVEAAEQAGVPILVGHHRRHNPMIQQARQLVQEGHLGRIVSVHGFFWLMKPDSYFNEAWRRQPGAGPVLINLAHDIDLMRYLCGEIAAIQAFQTRDVRQFEVDETTAITLRFANGALGTMNISDTISAPWSWEHTTGENAVYPQSDQICYFLGGTRGSLAIPRLELWSHLDAPDWWKPFATTRHIAPKSDPLRLQIQHFIRVIRGEEAPIVSGREGLRTLEAIDAVQRAAVSGQTIHLRVEAAP
jgi:predicted dehydrogenase